MRVPIFARSTAGAEACATGAALARRGAAAESPRRRSANPMPTRDGDAGEHDLLPEAGGPGRGAETGGRGGDSERPSACGGLAFDLASGTMSGWALGVTEA